MTLTCMLTMTDGLLDGHRDPGNASQLCKLSSKMYPIRVEGVELMMG